MGKIEKRPNFKEKLDHYRVPILQKGSQSFICCPNPNHSDKNPSCQINLNQSKETFFCHACGAKGDVFDLISLIELRDLKDVLREYSYNENISFRGVSCFDKKIQKKENSLGTTSKGSYSGISRESFKKEKNYIKSKDKDISISPFFQDISLKNPETFIKNPLKTHRKKETPDYFSLLSEKDYQEFNEKKIKQLAHRLIFGLKKNPYYQNLIGYNIVDTYPYHNPQGYVIGAMIRLEKEGVEGKVILQTTLGKDTSTERGKIRLFNGLLSPIFPSRLKPFGWQAITSKENLIICEGQKASKALAVYNNKTTSVLGLFGTQTQLSQIDFSGFENKKIYLWADNDTQGQEFMLKVEKYLKRKEIVQEVYYLNVNYPKKEKEDAHDWLNWRRTQIGDIKLTEIIPKETEEKKRGRPPRKNIFDPDVAYVDFDEKGRPQLTNDNLLALIEARNLKLGLDVWLKEVGIFDQDNYYFEDGDIASLLQREGLPIALRTTITETIAKKAINEKQGYINKLKDHVLSQRLDNSLNYIFEVFSCLEFQDHFMEHIPEDIRNIEIFKMWQCWLSLTWWQASHERKGDYMTKTVLVLHGDQSIRKSSFLGKITPSGFFKENIHFPQNDDEKYTVTKNAFIAEVAEFENMTPLELKKTKGYISQKTDSFRRKYGRNSFEYPRMTTFVATTNKSQILKDSDNVRFWMWELKSINYKKLKTILKTDKEVLQFWKHIAEALPETEELFDEIDRINKLHKKQNEKFRLLDATEEQLEYMFDLDRMEKKDYDGYLTTREIFMVAFKNTSFYEQGHAKPHQERTLADFMARFGLSRQSHWVKQKHKINSYKTTIKGFPVSLNAEFIDWIILNKENIDIKIK